jgi:hypothetical protein
MDLIQPFLGIVRAISWDGGDGVLEALEKILRDEAPFHSAEVAILGPIGFERCLFTSVSVIGDDALLDARRRGGHVKIDDIRDVPYLPKTRQLMDRNGLRSLLLLSLGEAGGIEGWIGLGRDHAYGFAGVSLRFLGPIAAMTGLALQKSRSLSKLHKRLPILVSVTPMEAVVAETDPSADGTPTESQARDEAAPVESESAPNPPSPAPEGAPMEPEARNPEDVAVPLSAPEPVEGPSASGAEHAAVVDPPAVADPGEYREPAQTASAEGRSVPDATPSEGEAAAVRELEPSAHPEGEPIPVPSAASDTPMAGSAAGDFVSEAEAGSGSPRPETRAERRARRRAERRGVPQGAPSGGTPGSGGTEP